jgi:hypothetical protein
LEVLWRYKRGHGGAELETTAIRHCKIEDIYTRADGLSLA